MKHVKKLLSAVLVLVLALTMVLPVAAEGANTLTIKSKTSGHTYQAYQIFAGTLDSEDKVLSDITWGSAIPEANQAATLEKIQGIKAGDPATALFADCKTAADVAAVLGEHNNDADLVDKFATVISECVQGNPATSGDPSGSDAEGYVYQILNLADGYYFVNETDQTSEIGNSYTKFMLQVVGNTEVNAKTDVPTADKKVQENSEKYDIDGGYRPGYNDVADYNIGDKVPFSFYSKVPDMTNFKTYKYIFHDKMSDGLTFNNDVVVTIGTTTLTKGTDYTVSTTEDGFKVEIENLKAINAATKDAEIRVDFTATLNVNAVVGIAGNPNTMTLEYSNNPNDSNDTTTGNPDTVIVFTYEIDVNKIDGANKDKLDGVQFKLYREVAGENNTTVKEYVKVDTNGKVTGWTTDKEEAGTTLTTANGGTFAVSGLDDGTYYLEETQPKDGYNTLAQPVKLEIKATTNNGQDWTDKDAKTALTALTLKTTIDPEHESTSTGDVNTGKVTTTVENYTGTTLPSTGGIGTTIFYIVGGILVVGAAVLLIAKKRTRM